MNKKAAKAATDGRIIARPFQFEFAITAYLEQDGKIVDTVRATDRIMEANFNGSTVQGLIDAAQAAMDKKIAGGG